MTDDIVSIYMTAADGAEAERIASILLEERLIACANILPQALSLYRWEGEIHREQEAIVFFKTTAGKADTVLTRIAGLHSYKVPAIMTLPVLAAAAPFAAWVRAETGA